MVVGWCFWTLEMKTTSNVTYQCEMVKIGHPDPVCDPGYTRSSGCWGSVYSPRVWRFPPPVDFSGCMEAHKAMGDGGCQKRREEGRGRERESERERGREREREGGGAVTWKHKGRTSVSDATTKHTQSFSAPSIRHMHEQKQPIWPNMNACALRVHEKKPHFIVSWKLTCIKIRACAGDWVCVKTLVKATFCASFHVHQRTSAVFF